MEIDERRRLHSRASRLRIRARILDAIRSFFKQREYLEVETPVRLPTVIPESHIDPLPSGDMLLQTSPEMCMKRLLAAGFPRIFQICRCFRQNERGPRHMPEFTMLEWYQAGLDYRGLMSECEELISWISASLGLGEEISYGGRRVSLQTPWERLSVEDAFARYAGRPARAALREGCFDELMVDCVEPHLGRSRPTFIYDYPASLAALARLKPGVVDVAERFELYIAGVELANGFSELNDPREQAERFGKVALERRQAGKAPIAVPHRFLEALEHMPAAAGLALGVDRLCMVLTGAARIQEVVAFDPEEL